LGGGIVSRALHLTWVVAAGAGAYFATLLLVGIHPRDFVKRAAE
jgi:putative peptidoglycan lipid II flippase